MSTTKPLHPEDFREALSRWPAGVAILTTVDTDGQRWGFTASAFASLSLNPPLVLVCLDRLADCHPAFCASDFFAVNILSAAHQELALAFATKGADKFAATSFEDGTLGVPILPDAVAAIECRTHVRYPGGDHTILVGNAEAVRLANADPLVYHARSFHTLPAAPPASAQRR